MSVAEMDARRAALLAETASDIAQGDAEAADAARETGLRSANDAVAAENKRLQEVASFFWPTAGKVTSPFGNRSHPILGYTRLHNGVDITTPCGTPVYAAQSGVVLEAATGYNGGQGNHVLIEHGDIDGVDVQTGYLHLQSFSVSVGQKVSKGERIAVVGTTGLSTGCHLHLALNKDGVGSDPLEYVHK